MVGDQPGFAGILRRIVEPVISENVYHLRSALARELSAPGRAKAVKLNYFVVVLVLTLCAPGTGYTRREMTPALEDRTEK